MWREKTAKYVFKIPLQNVNGLIYILHRTVEVQEALDTSCRDKYLKTQLLSKAHPKIEWHIPNQYNSGNTPSHDHSKW